jgi:hypothetical protein
LITDVDEGRRQQCGHVDHGVRLTRVVVDIEHLRTRP